MSRSAQHDARNAMILEGFKDLQVAKEQSVPTAKVIEARCKTDNLPWNVEDVPNSSGARIHWIGDQSAENVILYFHGGGYGLSAFEGHVMFLAECQKRLREQGRNVVIAMLEYGLTREVRYPTQYIQGLEALRLIMSKGYQPGNIIIGGDSAGGNLTLGMISLLLHPKEGMSTPSLSSPLAGVLLVSPWITFSTTAQSFTDNQGIDIVRAPDIHAWAADFCDEKDRDNYTEPLRADVEWWQNLPAKKLLNLAGTKEVFYSDIVAFGKTLTSAGVAVETVECKDQIHIDCILDAQTGLETGDMSHATWKWLDTVF